LSPDDPYAAATSAVPTSTTNQIPGNMVGNNSNTINTAEINLGTGGNGAIYGYTGSPSTANLYFSLAPAAGTDTYGNTYPAGINVLAGSIAGASMTGVSLDSTSVLNSSSVLTPSVVSPSISGGTAASLVHTMTNSSGAVLGYTSGSTSQTWSTAGTYSFTVPTSVSTMRVQGWGAAAGGGGGGATNEGGESGGGGEYAEEPSLSVNPGDVYTIFIGGGGQGGFNFQGGGQGGTTIVTPPSTSINPPVVANGAGATANYQGGNGGTGSFNTIHYDGGDGADAAHGGGGAGGGSSAGPSGEGNQGSECAGGNGGTGAAPPSGGGAGGAGGNTGLSGVSGSSPGGGGGGAGYIVTGTTTGSYSYAPSGTYSYWGNNGAFRCTTPLYQGLQPNNTHGQYQFSYVLFPYAAMQSELAGKVITRVALELNALHSTNGSTVLIQLQLSSQASFSSFASPTSGGTIRNWDDVWISLGKITHVFSSTATIGALIQDGGFKSLLIGPGSNWGATQTWGYFETPTLVVSYGNSATQAGNGGDGQVTITYGTGTPSYTLGISSVSSTDPYGNPVQAGVTSGQVTVIGSSTTPTSVADSSVVSANEGGNLAVTNSSGFSGYVPLTLTDTATYTGTGTTPAMVTAGWVIPAGDASEGSVYEVEVPFAGTYLNTITTQVWLNGANVAGDNAVGLLSTTQLTTGWVKGWVMVTGTGATGSCTAMIEGSVGLDGARTGTNAAPLTGVGPNKAFNTTIPNTVGIAIANGAGGGNTSSTTGYGSIFTRKGP
jgi:hypothetical protein